METSQLTDRRTKRTSGFTLMEVMVAVFVLAIGLLGIAVLMSQMNTSTTGSRYMSTEALLASEKLEDLNHYPSLDARVAAGGSLANDVPGYSDQIQVSSGAGNVVNGNVGNAAVENILGNGNYTQITHSPSGVASSQVIQGNPPAPTPDMVVFDRRWQIEANAPANGVRRITVLVRLANALVGQQTTFQMSMVRP